MALSQLTNVGPNLGQSYIIDSFVVVVFGGVWNLWGSLIGGLAGLALVLRRPRARTAAAGLVVLAAISLAISFLWFKRSFVHGEIDSARMYEALMEHAVLNEVMSEVSRIALEPLGRQELLQQIADYLQLHFPTCVPSILLLDDHGGHGHQHGPGF